MIYYKDVRKIKNSKGTTLNEETNSRTRTSTKRIGGT